MLYLYTSFNTSAIEITVSKSTKDSKQINIILYNYNASG